MNGTRSNEIVNSRRYIEKRQSCHTVETHLNLSLQFRFAFLYGWGRQWLKVLSIARSSLASCGRGGRWGGGETREDWVFPCGKCVSIAAA